MSRLADADDSGLLALVRDGDTSAMAELWSRHYPATLAAARRISRQPRDAEELASDAFSAMLQALGHDAGPTTSVRAYLTTAVRNQATSRARRASTSDVLTGEIADYEDPDRDSFDPVAHHAELGLVREAFASLPRRWQTVLWRTAVDHDSNKVIAADLGMSPNALAALARRARRGFRTAYLQAHASVQAVAPECEPYAGRLVELLPDQAPKAGPPATVRDHVDGCEACTRRLAALQAADTDLRAVLLPALLGLGPGIPWATTAAHSGHAAGALWLKIRPRSGHVGNAAMAGAAAAVVVAGTLSAYAVTRDDTAPPQGATARSAAYDTGAPAVAHSTPDHPSPRATASRRSPTPAQGTGSSGRQASRTDPPAPRPSAPVVAPPSTFAPAPPARRSTAPSPTSSATATSTPPPVTPTSPTSTATSTPPPTATSPVPSSPTATGSTSPTSTPTPTSSSPTGTPTSTTPSPTSSSPTCRICIGDLCIPWCFD